MVNMPPPLLSIECAQRGSLVVAEEPDQLEHREPTVVADAVGRGSRNQCCRAVLPSIAGSKASSIHDVPDRGPIDPVRRPAQAAQTADQWHQPEPDRSPSTIGTGVAIASRPLGIL